MVVCRRYTNDQDTAQEILQDGFIKIFDKLGAFDYKGSFEGWIRRIFVNTAIDSIRKSKKVTFTDNENEFKNLSENKVEELEDFELTSIKAEVAMKAIEKLSPAYRTVFNMYVIEEYSHKEISEILNISEGTSKSNLAKARMNLQKILNEQFTSLNQ